MYHRSCDKRTLKEGNFNFLILYVSSNFNAVFYKMIVFLRNSFKKKLKNQMKNKLHVQIIETSIFNGFLFRSEIFFQTTQELEYLFIL
jgi:hypothetical protein